MRHLLLLCFFLTGTAGLIYEVVWTRLLLLLFGSTVQAVSTVLTSFMAGLALGSFIFGRFVIPRVQRPLLTYAMLEVAVGLYCLAVPFLIDAVQRASAPLWHSWLQDAPLAFSLARFALVFAVLLFPTTLMGATLPLLCKAAAGREPARAAGSRHQSADGPASPALTKMRAGAVVGDLYAINTAGAVLGCLLAGFFILPLLGIAHTIWLAAALNFAVAAAMLALGRDSEAAASQDAVPRPSLQPSLVLAVAALSGALSLAYEVAWTRVLALVMGTTTYAFAAMLTAYLGGLALGSFLCARRVDRWKDAAAALAALQAAAALTGLVLALLLPHLPRLYTAWVEAARGPFWMNQVGMIGLACLVLVPQAAFFGAVFPLAARMRATSPADLPRAVGDVYAANTLGCIAGAFAAGFIFVPALGLEGTLRLLALLGLGAALALAWKSDFSLQRRQVMVGGGAALALALLALPTTWDNVVLSSGMYSKPYLLREIGFEKYLAAVRNASLVYYKDGENATISVLRVGDYLAFRTNGKVEATTLRTDMINQLTLAHAPLLLVPEPRRAMVIGLGAGITAGGVVRHGVASTDIVELEPAVKGAADMFGDLNGRPWNAPGARLHLADGRTFVLGAQGPYDVITSDPIHPFSRGSGNLYSYDHYVNCRRLLAPRGLMCQWLPLYDMTTEDIRVITASFAAAFPHASVWSWHIPGKTKADSLLIGGLQPIEVDVAALNRRMAGSGSMKEIALEDAADFASGFLMSDAVLRRWTQGAPLNTDDRPYLEFSAPRGVYEATSTSWEDNYNAVVRAAGDELPPMVGTPSRQWYEELAQAFALRGRTAKAKRCLAEFPPRP